MNELEKMADDVQARRDKLYKFLDEHYDFSDKELVDMSTLYHTKNITF